MAKVTVENVFDELEICGTTPEIENIIIDILQKKFKGVEYNGLQVSGLLNKYYLTSRNIITPENEGYVFEDIIKLNKTEGGKVTPHYFRIFHSLGDDKCLFEEVVKKNKTVTYWENKKKRKVRVWDYEVIDDQQIREVLYKYNKYNSDSEELILLTKYLQQNILQQKYVPEDIMELLVCNFELYTLSHRKAVDADPSTYFLKESVIEINSDKPHYFRIVYTEYCGINNFSQADVKEVDIVPTTGYALKEKRLNHERI